MNKLLYSFLALGLLATVSCSDDDSEPAPKPEPEPDPIVKNEVAYNGKKFELDYGVVIDFGAADDHYNYGIFLTDGELDFTENQATDASIIIFADLYSAGSDEFSPGTFNYNASGNVDGKNYFETLQVLFDTNDNGTVDDDDEVLNVEGGKVIASDEDGDLAIELDITLENGKALKGKYSGDFDTYDATEALAPAQHGRMARISKRGLK